MAFDYSEYTSAKSKTVFAITFAVIISLLIFINSTIISNISFRLNPSENRSVYYNQLQTYQTCQQQLRITPSGDHAGRCSASCIDLKDDVSVLFDSSGSEKYFNSEVKDFFESNQCKAQIFMTWISPADVFGEREFFGLKSLFRTNPKSCVIILSRTMDSEKGYEILEPLINKGFRVRALSLDLWSLVKNTPAESWFSDIKNGKKDAGEIPLGQNLSNLIRLTALYKFGGVYLDTDFIILKDISGLRNSIGAQSVDAHGNWTRLNNALLIFDKNHPLVYKFIEEFASTFNGNKWGYNGPYLVSRVVGRLKEDLSFTILPPRAFYPVYWTRVVQFFARPNQHVGAKWIDAKIRQLNKTTYGVHLWNSQSKKLKIEEGSIIARLISDNGILQCGAL